MTTTRYTKNGTGTGVSWSDARPLVTLGAGLKTARPDDVALVGSDRDREDPVFWNQTIARLSASGTPSDPIRLAFGLISHPDGVSKATPGTGMAQFRKSDIGFLERVDPERWGDPFLVLESGASNLAIYGPVFFGAPAAGFVRFSSAAAMPYENILMSDIHGQMAGRVIETEDTAVLRNVTVERCSVSGAFRGFARFHDLSASRLRNIDIDAAHIDSGEEGDFQGISVVAGTDVRMESIVIRNGSSAWTQGARGDFVQGDGIVCEEETSDFVLLSCHARNMGDGGFDLKTKGVRLVECSAISCKYGIRIWRQSPDNLLERCVVEAPYSQANNQSTCLWCGGSVLVANSRLRASGLGGSVVRFGDGPDSGTRVVTIRGGEIATGAGGYLVRGEPGRVVLEDVTLDGRRTSAIIEWDGTNTRIR